MRWVNNAKGRKAHIYWGLLVSGRFCDLPIAEQAILILLHGIYHRRKNRLTIHPRALQPFGVHRTKLPSHIDRLRKAGLLEYVEGHTYAFPWINEDGKPDFSRI